MSHPAWVCGLKPEQRVRCTPIWKVTPCVGVWIETGIKTTPQLRRIVTPCVGVWIETGVNWHNRQVSERHTLRGCVDWNKSSIADEPHLAVTPCVGVWIETFLGSSASSTSCHTLRGCVDWNGKQLNQHLILHCHTLRGCVDWNFTLCNLYYWPRVTPCVGVWIETIMHPRQTGQGIVTPCVGVWIETYSEHIANVQKGHTLRGCVDWNWEACAGYIMDVVTPCVGVWIETMTRWIRV